MARRGIDDWHRFFESNLGWTSEAAYLWKPTLARSGAWEPRVDVFETPHHVYVKAELPGVPGEDIRLYFNPAQGTLTLRGEREEAELPADEPGECHLLEIAYGAFEREIPLPECDYDPSDVSARVHQGFLLVRIGKATAPQRVTVSRRTIRIRQI